jgi:predicted N-acyltransferase
VKLSISFVSSIAQICASQWDQVVASDNPFVKHAFLNALEQSHCVCSETGWQISHLVAEDQTQRGLVALMPLYIKQHSYGEYIFDWSWAKAYQNNGLDYYPKLLSAIPFTPVTGPRLAIHPDHRNAPGPLLKQIHQALIERALALKASNVQCLFTDSSQALANVNQLDQHQWLQRTEVQFHWFNQDYLSFEHFLARMTSRKRKNISKERLKVAQQNISFEHIAGADISESLWQIFVSFYQATYLKRSGHAGYLNVDFFYRIGKHLAAQLFMVVAKHQGEIVAAALFFHDQHNLYGRYWGCSTQFEFLHFETCYYQGIDYCIAHKLRCFNAGAQGEHKVQRGFEPVSVEANYLVFHQVFNRAIDDYLVEESRHQLLYQNQMRERLPFKNDS